LLMTAIQGGANSPVAFKRKVFGGFYGG